MTKFFALFVLTFCYLTTFAQENVDEYVKKHNYSFDLDDGFDRITSDTLKIKFGKYKLIIQSEANHTLDFYKKLPIVWIKFLNNNLGLTHFFLEWGHATDILANKYLHTGDSSYLFTTDKTFWKTLYYFNSKLPQNSKLHYFGVDFERNRTYIKALKLILPNTLPKSSIKQSIELIKSMKDSVTDCDYILSFNDELKQSVKKNKAEFIEYFGESYNDFERIIFNKGSCNDVNRNRNWNMASTFLSYDQQYDSWIYYGELGMAHANLKYKFTTASILNNSGKFKDKVCVISSYCYNCVVQNEVIENGYFSKIENDIIRYLLPYCKTDFTLFDFSDGLELTKKFSEYGQYLIIAKNQN